MTIKTILMPRDNLEISTEVLTNGVAVARTFNAHIEVLLLRRDPEKALPFVFGTLSSTNLRKTVIDAVNQSENERAAEIRQRFDEYCARHTIMVIDKPPPPAQGVSASWREAEPDELIMRSRLADLIVVARPQNIAAAPQTLETALLESKRPVLVVPDQTQTSIAKHIAIGWNSSAESAQAVASALPFLQKANKITVFSSAKRQQHALQLIDYLAWHEIQSELCVFDVKSRSVGETLLSQAHSRGVDLFVIGGYSRTRASQLLFGGVTQYFIANAEIPVLMAH